MSSALQCSRLSHCLLCLEFHMGTPAAFLSAQLPHWMKFQFSSGLSQPIENFFCLPLSLSFWLLNNNRINAYNLCSRKCSELPCTQEPLIITPYNSKIYSFPIYISHNFHKHFEIQPSLYSWRYNILSKL